MADEVPDGSGADSTEGSGGFRGGWLMRFWRVRVQIMQQSSGGLLQMADEVPKGYGADSTQGSGGFRCRWAMRFRRVPAQMADEVPEGSGADG